MRVILSAGEVGGMMLETAPCGPPQATISRRG